MGDNPRWPKKLRDRRARADVANRFIQAISEHGRRFFHYEGCVSYFEVDYRGRVWYVDSWKGKRIYTHQNGGWGRHFHHGGTLLDLCKRLREFIMGREPLPLRFIGPWPDDYCGGDLWGYGKDEMEAVRRKCLVCEREFEVVERRDGWKNECG